MRKKYKKYKDEKIKQDYLDNSYDRLKDEMENE
jgi:hypothetical protein